MEFCSPWTQSDALTYAMAIHPAVYNTLSMEIAHTCAFMISSYLAIGVAQPVLDLNG